ncbi:MAG: hypothetical protein RR653_11390, partial [Clostridia bacterium]
MTICELKQRTRLSEWRTAIQQQKASGQSIKQWCEENNCGEGKYYYWLKQVRQEMLEQGSASTVALVQFEPERLPVAAVETPMQKSPLQAAAVGRGMCFPFPAAKPRLFYRYFFLEHGADCVALF